MNISPTPASTVRRHLENIETGFETKFYSAITVLLCLEYMFAGFPPSLQPDVPHAHTQREEAVHLQDLRQGLLPQLRPEEAHEEAARLLFCRDWRGSTTRTAAPRAGLPQPPHDAPALDPLHEQALVTPAPTPQRRQDPGHQQLTVAVLLRCGCSVTVQIIPNSVFRVGKNTIQAVSQLKPRTIFPKPLGDSKRGSCVSFVQLVTHQNCVLIW